MLIFFDSACFYSSRKFLHGVAGSAGKVICKANFVPEAAAKKSLYSLILCVSLYFKKKKKKSTAQEKSGTTPLFQTNLYLLHTDRLEIMLVEQNMVES